MFNLIVSQGRIADRNKGMIDGARMTADEIMRKYNTDALRVGTFAQAKNDNWPESLAEAKDNLLLIQSSFVNLVNSGEKSVFVSNTCSASLATLPIIAKKYPDAIVLWIDAHGDFNTPDTTTSGYLGGMVCAAASGLWDSGLGAGLNPSQLILVGARDIDTEELALINSANVRVVRPSSDMVEKILLMVKSSPIYIHIDWDVMEPGYLPADYSVPDGLTPDQILQILSSLPKSQILGLEIAEFVPSYDDATDMKALETILYMIKPILEG